MGDRTQVQFIIGGNLPAALVDDFVDAIRDEYFGVEWEGFSETEVRAAIHAGAPLCLNANEVNYASADAIEAFCGAHGLPYVKTWDAGGGYGPGLEVFNGEGVSEYATTGINDGAPLLDAVTFAALETREAVAAWFAAASFTPPALKII
jgi:hypothetical protein